MSEPADNGPQQPPITPPAYAAPAWAPPGPTPATGGHRPLIIALSAIAAVAMVAAIVLGVLYAQADSDTKSDTSSERATDDRAVSVANAVAQSVASAPTDGNWTAWQAKLCDMAQGDFRTMACSASTLGQYQQLHVQSVATVWSSGIASRTPTSRVVLVVTTVTGGSSLSPTVTSQPQVMRVTVDTTTWKVQKLEAPK
jgi:hypothetical protein